MTQYPMNLVQTMVNYLYTGVMERPHNLQYKVFDQLLTEYGLMPEYTVNPRDLEQIGQVQETIKPQREPCTQTDNWEGENDIKQELVTEYGIERDIGGEIKKEIEYTVEDHSMDGVDNVGDDISDNDDIDDDHQTIGHALDGNVPDKMKVETDRFETDLNVDKINDMGDKCKARVMIEDHSISDTVNELGGMANVKEIMHTSMDNSISERDDNCKQNIDREKIRGRRPLSQRQEWMEWDSDDEEWMEKMEKEFAEWKKNHSCDFCDGLDDITKLMDHFYEMKGYEM